MNDNEQTPDVQSPSQRAIVIASIAGFVSLILVYWIARPAVVMIEVGWAELLIFAIIPVQ
jgi:hypothetical protein